MVRINETIKNMTVDPLPQLNTDGLEAAARNYAAVFSNDTANAASFMGFMEGYRVGRGFVISKLDEAADKVYTTVKAYEQMFNHYQAEHAALELRNGELQECKATWLELQQENKKLADTLHVHAENNTELGRKLQEAESNHVNKDLQIEINNLRYDNEQKQKEIERLEAIIAAVNLEKLTALDGLRLLQEIFQIIGRTRDRELMPGSHLYKRIDGYLELMK